MFIRQNSFLFAFIIVLLMPIMSCIKNNEPIASRRTIDKFFTLPVKIKPEVLRVVNELKRQNEMTGFIKTLAAKQGYARWDKAQVTTAKSIANKHASKDADENSPKGDASNFTDSVRWNLPYSQALGALLHIDIPGPIGTSNDGSVVLSDYNSMINTFQHHYFKFSTLETYFDKEHPVAGNREFGIYNSSVNLTQFTFYTMGVDRTWDWITDLLAKYGFGKSDELWHNIQNNFKLFINHTGGQAVNFNPKSFTPRPNYQAIKDFLEGKIDKSELKTRLGC